jgi:hypothetical protein
MSVVTKDFTAAGNGDAFTLPPGRSASYAVAGTFTGFAKLQRSNTQGQTWQTEKQGAADTGISGTVKNEGTSDLWLRFVVEDTDSETPVTGTVETSLADVPVGVRKIILNAGAASKAGTSSGWATAAVDSKSLATLAASLSSKALVVPVPGLAVGDTIVGFHLVGQIESAGNAVVVDAALRKHTAAAADVADAAVASMTQLSVSADTILSAANTRKGNIEEVVGIDETFYILITGTTLGSTDIALQGVVVEVVPAPVS